MRELRRVARPRVVVFQWDPALLDAFWLVRDYLTGFSRLPGMTLEELSGHVGATRVEPVPIPHDCR